MASENMNSTRPHIKPTTSAIMLANRWDHFLARIEKTSLRELVKHRKLILPQLGATGNA